MELGLEVNTEKCEIFFLKEDCVDDMNNVNEICRGINVVEDFTLLEAAVTFNVKHNKRRRIEIIDQTCGILSSKKLFWNTENDLFIPNRSFVEISTTSQRL